MKMQFNGQNKSFLNLVMSVRVASSSLYRIYKYTKFIKCIAHQYRWLVHWTLTPEATVRTRDGPFDLLLRLLRLYCFVVMAQLVQQRIANPSSRSNIRFRGSSPRHDAMLSSPNGEGNGFLIRLLQVRVLSRVFFYITFKLWFLDLFYILILIYQLMVIKLRNKKDMDYGK